MNNRAYNRFFQSNFLVVVGPPNNDNSLSYSFDSQPLADGFAASVTRENSIATVCGAGFNNVLSTWAKGIPTYNRK